ncbi:MAG TPA: sulfite exporter TauE/SafE family protein [Dinghuibacter sp.]|jgi:uncharacterized membrane protein YfcA|uniref:sulfite exporter TauE/SafE family protein n=1 Tax=Dinghuibacter sp. TaxID=2024697 RepID=UPI002CF9A523|nr:sulfite exporter TauE/SafE family protein [Dinghuibacter sp.]HTJ13694.1 sulfite exporter TauE/SafE family protein [Dinghuibacter sp.]
MTILVFTGILLIGAFAAGLLGSLTGLGGGVVIIPLLTLGFGVDIRYAIGSSLVAVIATSSGSAVAYVKEGYSNIRLGMFLEVATTTGAILGAFLAIYAPTHLIAIIFGTILILSTASSYVKKQGAPDTAGSALAAKLTLNGQYPDGQGGWQAYGVHRVYGGFGMMTLAGMLSGLLGVGSGALKVIAIDNIMRVPFKVSTTTSNFMIGVTAAASAGIYLYRGYIDPGIAMPVVLGVLGGAFLGSRILAGARPAWLRVIFTVVVVFLAVEMIYNGATHRI